EQRFEFLVLLLDDLPNLGHLVVRQAQPVLEPLNVALDRVFLLLRQEPPRQKKNRPSRHEPLHRRLSYRSSSESSRYLWYFSGVNAFSIALFCSWRTFLENARYSSWSPCLRRLKYSCRLFLASR